MPKQILEKIAPGALLEKSDLQFFFTEKASDSERKAFLLAINESGVAPQQMAVFVDFLLPQNFPVAKFSNGVDICGTGGSGLQRINTSTIASFVLAACGVPIAKHGNRAGGGRFGSFDLLESLGVKIDCNENELAQTFARENLAFIFAQKFFPPMRFFAQARKELGVATIFNLLGPLLNPAQVKAQVVGTGTQENAMKIVQAAGILGRKKFAALTSENGLDEVSTCGTTFVFELGEGGKVRESQIKPQDFGLQQVEFAAIASPDFQENSRIAQEILRGQDSPHANLVLANCAFVLKFLGKVDSLPAGICLAQEKLKNGEAWAKLESLRNFPFEK